MLPPSLMFGNRVCVTLKTAFKLTLSVLELKKETFFFEQMEVFKQMVDCERFSAKNSILFRESDFLTRQSPSHCIHQSAYKWPHRHYSLIRRFLHFSELE